MTIRRTISFFAVAASLSLGSTTASANSIDEIEPEAIAATVRYTLPLAFEGYVTACFDNLDESGFVVTNAEQLRSKFGDGADEAWPAAREAIFDIVRTESSEDIGDTLDGIDDDILRPLFDTIIEAKIAEEISPKDCANIETVLEILDPLPAENVSVFAGFLFQLFQEDSRQRTLRIESTPPNSEEAPVAQAIDETEMTESQRRKLREQEEERARKQ